MNDDMLRSIALIQKTNNYPGAERLTKLVKQALPEVTKTDIKKYLSTHITSQLTAKPVRQQTNGHVVAFSPNEIWNMDIFDLSRYYKDNDGYRYLLVCIDIFSRKAYVKPLKSKQPLDVEPAFMDIILKNQVKPRCIVSDREGAFLSKTFEKRMRMNNIILNINALGDHRALGIIDNFAKRIKTILSKMFLEYKNTVWLKDINRIVSKYNDTEHEALEGLSPNEATKPENIEKIHKLNLDKNEFNKTVSDLNIGDKVRKDILFNEKSIIKGTDPRWSDQVYIVEKVNGNTINI